MGLDTIAYKEFRNGEHIQADSDWFKGTEMLSRGIMGGDLAWIRGKTYALLVEEVSGVNLYEESISNDVVWKIANAFKSLNDDPLKYRDIDYLAHYHKNELKALEKWFFIAAERGCYLHGWW